MSLGPAAEGGADDVVVVGATVVAVAVVVVIVVETVAEVVITADDGVLTLETLVLVGVGVAGSTLLRGRRTLVVTSAFVVLATGSGSSLLFSMIGVATVSSLAARTGLLAAFGLASELGARISGLSLMFSLIGGKLPNVLLF